MKQTMRKVWKKLVIFWRELGNAFTNLFCPILSIVAATMELLQLPAAAIKAIKKAEEWCYKTKGTKNIIDNMVNNIDEIVDKNDDDLLGGE